MLLSCFANIRTTQMKKDEHAEILVSYIGFLVRMTINVYLAPWAKTMMLVCNDKHPYWGYWGAGPPS